MWTCPSCERIFDREAQSHSCHKVPLDQHFKNKEKALELFNFLTEQVGNRIGKYRIISIPCCVHLFGSYDFLAALPKRDKLEIRFALNRELNTPRLKQSVRMSTNVYKNCFDVTTTKEIDAEFIGWINESYHLKDRTDQNP